MRYATDLVLSRYRLVIFAVFGRSFGRTLNEIRSQTTFYAYLVSMDCTCRRSYNVYVIARTPFPCSQAMNQAI